VARYAGAAARVGRRAAILPLILAALWLARDVPHAAGLAEASRCTDLTKLHLPLASVDDVQVVDAGRFEASGRVSVADATLFQATPAFCRVSVTARPVSESRIGIEVWLPLNGWNQRFQGVGNRGWGGSISYALLASAVRDGYVAAATDTGHRGPGARFAVGHPEAIVDSGDRAVHVMTEHAKAIMSAYYDRPPQYAYWNGCSLGGRQGLAEAQRHPADYDGIVVGDVANDVTHIYAARVAMAQRIRQGSATPIPPEKYPIVHRAAVDACDAADGSRDGLIADPLSCRVDPAVAACPAGATDTRACLTPGEVAAARVLYDDVVHPQTGALIAPGLERGSELGWSAVAGPQPEGNAVEMFRFAVFNDPTWSWEAFDLARDTKAAEDALAPALDAVNPDLRPFFARGGRLLMYHGWADPQTPPRNSIRYVQAVRAASGSAAANALRLFMVPGMGHCEGGDGPDQFDAMTPLVAWRERGTVPSAIEAVRVRAGQIDRRLSLHPFVF
jgi:feruloyl esterase